MRDQVPQPIVAAELPNHIPLSMALLALNNAHAQELSWLEPARLQHLVAQAFLARRIGNIDAFLLAFDQDADYDSPNFLWFRARYPRFVYQNLFEHAERAGYDRVVCEVNSHPPNPTSDAFHAALGFVVVGTASVYNDSRTVRYLSRMLSAPKVD